uniref:Vesicle associated membrane protein 1a n=1 Tax=Oncorhynchus kisutch TaxID=8019 RepID=A0A8C7GH68_ONCKI
MSTTDAGTPGAPEGEGGPPAPAPNLTSNRRLQQTQAQVDEVVDIMRVNVDKVLERDQRLSELDDRADALQAGASQFESSAAKLKNKYWWKNLKMMIIMAIMGVICVGVVFCKYHIYLNFHLQMKSASLDSHTKQHMGKMFRQFSEIVKQHAHVILCCCSLMSKVGNNCLLCDIYMVSFSSSPLQCISIIELVSSGTDNKCKTRYQNEAKSTLNSLYSSSPSSLSS